VDALLQAREHIDRGRLTRTKNGNVSFKLGNVYQALTGKYLQGAHGALADAVAIIALYRESSAMTKSLMDCLTSTGEKPCWASNPLSLVRARVKQCKEKNAKPTTSMDVAAVVAAIKKKKKRKKMLKKSATAGATATTESIDTDARAKRQKK